jgi:hypothetical protein
MSATLLLILIPLAALAPEPVAQVDLGGGTVRVQVSMGPDPGGHSGDKVTPETTKTGQPTADSASNHADPVKSNSNGQQSPSSEPEKASTQPQTSNPSDTKR